MGWVDGDEGAALFVSWELFPLETILALLIIRFCSPFSLRCFNSSLSALLISHSLMVRSGDT